MLGKQKCRILKEIRQRIADENDIPYVTRECAYQGECRGTCPRCESELRYLERQLAARAALGKRAAVAALCAGIALGAAGCGPFGQKADDPADDIAGMIAVEPEPTPEVWVTTGEVAWPEDEPEDLPPEETGEAEPYPEAFELSGDVAWPEA